MSTHRMSLGDDGTLDTVIVCRCGAEYRYNADDMEHTPYAEFVEWALEDAATQHDQDLDGDGFCGCETIRHFDGNAGHPYGRANGTTRPTTVYGLAGEPFCEECQRICEPAILTGKPFVETRD